jgi:hypothetical protein
MLETISWISLSVAFVSSIVIAIDEVRHPQKMWIMNIVWPVTALYFSVFAVWAYFRFGRPMTREAMAKFSGQEHKRKMAEGRKDPTWSQIGIAVSHCGSGCAIADVITEFTLFGLGVTVLGSSLWASYVFDFIAAWTLGVVFQYFTIKPMRDLSPMQGIRAAIKADTFSITAFQLGMYGWMALVFFVFFPRPHLEANQPEYWLMMQIAMILGFLSSYPMNKFLIKAGWKEVMG